MSRRLQAFIAIISVALMAIDAIVCVWGHSHGEEPLAVAVPTAAHHHGGGCSHHHQHAGANEGTQHSSGSEHRDCPSPDDCAMCRHFSQPVSPSIVVVEISACERVEGCVSALVPRMAAVVASTHSARGPPTLVA